jgi:hypothetical protein
MRARRSLVRLALLGLLAVAATGCRIDVLTDITFDVDGAGIVDLSVRIDGATLRDLDRLGVDPGLDVDAALDPAAGWRASRRVDADGGLVLAYRRAFADGEELAALLRELSAGLAPGDPALQLDLDVVTRRRGAVELDGTVGIAAPSTTGVLLDGEPVGPSGAELERLTAAAVRGVLRVTTPGALGAHDGDRAGERVVEWDLPVAGERRVSLRSEAPGWWTTVPWLVVPLLALAGGLAWRLLRRSAPSEGAHGGADDEAGDAEGGISPAE